MKLYTYITHTTNEKKYFIDLDNAIKFATEDVKEFFTYRNTYVYNEELTESTIMVYFDTIYGTKGNAIIRIIETED